MLSLCLHTCDVALAMVVVGDITMKYHYTKYYLLIQRCKVAMVMVSYEGHLCTKYHGHCQQIIGHYVPEVICSCPWRCVTCA